MVSTRLTQNAKQNLGANVFTGLDCDPNPVFVPKTYSLPHLFFLGEDTTLSFSVAPMQFHTLALATFASLIAPFGGFFASGLKRTFKIKDFGQSIPGHGGMTDRMDCPKSLILNVRLRPEAKKPPNGAISDAKVASASVWNCIGATENESVVSSPRKKKCGSE